MQQFQEAQGQLGSALKRLLVVSERYPDLKANQGFVSLQEDKPRVQPYHIVAM